ncbi:MAG: tetratricopeptide repeat protein [Verrucomicrobiia bacterium]
MSGDTTAIGLSAVADPAASPHRWKTILGGGMIVLAALAAYHNSFTVPFLFDDPHAIEDNPTIRHLWPIGDVLSPPPTSFVVGGRPVLNLSLAVCYALGGLAVWWYHAFNLVVHVLAGLTLYGIMRRTLARPALRERFGASGEWVALAVAVLWTVHPLQTEAVTYIYQRCESLMGLFYLLTLYCFIRGAESGRSVGWFGLSVASCFLGMASKEVMVTAPLMVLLYDRTFVSGSFRGTWGRHRRLYLELASSWLWLGYLMVGLHARGIGYGLGTKWWGYAPLECRVVVQYLRLTVWPHPLILDYGQHAAIGPLAAAAPYALILAVLATGVLFALKRQPAIGFVGAWFFVILAPTSSVVPIGGSPMAEHRMYLPLAAVVTMAVVGAVALGKRLFDRQQGVVLGCVAGGSVTVLLTFLSIQRNQDYNSPVTIWQGTVEKYPNNSRAHYNLGAALLQSGELQDAIGHLEQAVRIQPDFAEAHNSAGVALEQAGRVQEAIGHYERALQIRPDFADAHNNLGIALMRQGRLAEAIGQYEQALRIQPDYVRAQCNWANALLRMGQVPEAIQHYEQALRIQPDFAEVHYNVGLALEKVGRTPEAIQHYEQALRIRPDFVQAQYALARLRGTE